MNFEAIERIRLAKNGNWKATFFFDKKNKSVVQFQDMKEKKEYIKYWEKFL